MFFLSPNSFAKEFVILLAAPEQEFIKLAWQRLRDSKSAPEGARVGRAEKVLGCWP